MGVFGLIAAPLALPVTAFADGTTQIQNGLACGSNLGQGLNGAGGLNGCDQSTDNNGGLSVSGVMTLIINIFSIIVGFIAVVMIIVGGVRYITSGGDSSNISAAKNTIIYAIIGLIIVALAQVIVHFVLNKLGNS
jgi:hypothetical protein